MIVSICVTCGIGVIRCVTGSVTSNAPHCASEMSELRSRFIAKQQLISKSCRAKTADNTAANHQWIMSHKLQKVKVKLNSRRSGCTKLRESGGDLWVWRGRVWLTHHTLKSCSRIKIKKKIMFYGDRLFTRHFPIIYSSWFTPKSLWYSKFLKIQIKTLQICQEAAQWCPSVSSSWKHTTELKKKKKLLPSNVHLKCNTFPWQQAWLTKKKKNHHRTLDNMRSHRTKPLTVSAWAPTHGGGGHKSERLRWLRCLLSSSSR